MDAIDREGSLDFKLVANVLTNTHDGVIRGNVRILSASNE